MKSQHKEDNKSQRPSGPNAGPESGASLKSGLAARYQVSRGHSSLGMDVGTGARPKARKGEKVKAPSGQTYTWG